MNGTFSKKDFVLILSFLWFGTFILLYKFKSEYYHGNSVIIDNRIDEVEFGKLIIDPFSIVKEKIISLIVFMDLNSDCPACLSEAPYWVKPLSKYEEYNLILFIRNSVTQNELHTFLLELGLDPKKHAVLFEKDSDIASLHQNGVLKVVFSSEKGILWHQYGSHNEKEYQAFYGQLLSTLSTELH